MTDKTQPEALRLADELAQRWGENMACPELEAAAELRRLHAENERLSGLCDKWNSECDEFREDNKRLAALVEAQQHTRIAELEAELEAVGAGGVQALSAAPAGWRELAAKVMDALADAQDTTNSQYPEHVRCYPSWERHARWLRWHADMFRSGNPVGNGAGNPDVLAALAASPTPPAEQQAAPKAAPGEQQAASSAVLKAIREANMQLVRTGDDTFMLVTFKQATAQTDSQPSPVEVADAVADSQYLAGVSAGWNAANADDPNEALRKLHESRAGYLKPIRTAARAPALSAAPAVGDELRDTLVAVSAAIAEQDDRAAQKMIGEILAASPAPPAEQPTQPGAVYAELPQPDSWFHFTPQYWGNKLRDFADRTHALRQAVIAPELQAEARRRYDAAMEQAAPKAAPGEQFDADGFRAWVRQNLPDDTIIGSSTWWADHLTTWAQRFVKAAPQPAPAPLSDEREAFESTWEKLYGKKPVLWDTAFKEAKMDVPAHSAGKYFYRDAQSAWKAWQARAALAAQGDTP